MSDIIRMAVVGVGWAGSHHVEGARELGRKVAVTCLVDRDPDHLQAKAEGIRNRKDLYRSRRCASRSRH